jgi:hypothetical protein
MGMPQSISRVRSFINAPPLAAALLAARFALRSGYTQWEVMALFIFFQFLEQLLFQMPARCLFDCASLCHYCFLLHLAFSWCSWFGGLRQVLYLRPIRAHSSLFWFCVWIH